MIMWVSGCPVVVAQYWLPGFNSLWLQAVLLSSTKHQKHINLSSHSRASNFKISILIISTCMFIMSPLHHYRYIILSHYSSNSTDEVPLLKRLDLVVEIHCFVLQKSSTIPKAVEKWALGDVETPPNFWHFYVKDIACSTLHRTACSES